MDPIGSKLLNRRFLYYRDLGSGRFHSDCLLYFPIFYVSGVACVVSKDLNVTVQLDLFRIS